MPKQGEAVVGCGELTWRTKGSGEVGDDGGRQPGGTDGVFPVAPMVRLRTREIISVSLMRSLNRCWS